MTTDIRQAMESDIPQIVRILNYYILNTNALPRRHSISAEEQSNYMDRLRKTDLPFLILERENQFIGFAYLDQFTEYESFAPTVESHIYLAPDWLHLGLGTMLLRELVRRAALLGRRTMVARIDSTNTASIRIHQKCGFSSVGILIDIGYKNGCFVSSTYMQILFEGPFNFY